MDKITLKNIHLSCHIGVPDDERAMAQPIFVDVTLHMELSRAGRDDSIDATVNYASVHKTVLAVAEKSYRTIEGLAESIASSVKFNFEATYGVDVVVRKPYALRFKGVDYASVEISR